MAATNYPGGQELTLNTTPTELAASSAKATVAETRKKWLTASPLVQFFVGLCVGLLLIFAVIYGATLAGGISLVMHGGDYVSDIWYWLAGNLGSSIIAFLAVFVLYLFHLLALRREVAIPEPSETRIILLDHRLDLLAGVCFGIGVVYTAIGLRAALLQALGGLDEDSARALGAFNVLKRLVDGGILLALTTTIVGGVAGYIMRVIKNFWLGGRVIEFFHRKGDKLQQEVLTRLDAIKADSKSGLTEKSGFTEKEKPAVEKNSDMDTP